jgi:tryptophan synthase alpha subunit
MYGQLILNLLSGARNNQVDWRQSFIALEAIRKAYPQAELQPVGFYGGIARMGQGNYISRCKELGIRAVDVPDYPLVHDNDPLELAKALRDEDIDLVTIIGTDLAMANEGTPSYETLVNVVKQSTGFTFLLAVAGGRTGTRSELDYKGLELAKTRVLDLQRQTKTRCPLVAVCGISTPQQVKTIVKSLGMHVMFGSAFYEKLLYGSGDDEVIDFVRQMKDAAS